MDMESLYVINSRGEKEPFSVQKLYRSLGRVDAPVNLIRNIADAVKKESYPGIRTSEIFDKIRKELHNQAPKPALRFNLKEGIRKLGPTGFPFEKFVGEIFNKLGFAVEINQHLPGLCIADYEIDFIAKKGKIIYVGECKYRNVPGEMVHSKDVLANYARFLDIARNGPYFRKKNKQNYKIKTILVTNAKFTGDVIKYSTCMGIELLGWRYPENRGLEHLIDKYNLYPVTTLPSLRGYLRDIFSEEKIMLAQDILKINPEIFSKKFNVSINHLYSIIKEAKLLLGKDNI